MNNVLIKIEPRPYRLFRKIQNYEWGTKNENAFIPNLLGIKAESNVPYAELWIGAHPKATSEVKIDGKRYPLNELIEECPNEILGEYVAKKFNNKLPFLLKILSASKALSIQAHPDKEQAKVLHEKDPINYPDDNHKPEIAIAVDELTALAGFRPTSEIKEILMRYPEIEELVGRSLIRNIIENNNENELAKNIELLYKAIMLEADNSEELSKVIQKLVQRFSSNENLTVVEEQFLTQYKLYGNDVGLLSFFLFNVIRLQPGQGIFTDAGIPHAYIKGNIIECMANSDNVVRAGLTNKFKDVEVLLNLLNYKFSEYKVLNEEQQKEEIVYQTNAEEFRLKSFQPASIFYKKFDSNSRAVIILVMEGSIEIEYQNEESTFTNRYLKGEAFLIPALQSKYKIQCGAGSKFIQVEVP